MAYHCTRCGHAFETADWLGPGLWPSCECAGDPPVDRESPDWSAYVARVARLQVRTP